jgi:membrane protease YdiL (CAAX protease family)
VGLGIGAGLVTALLLLLPEELLFRGYAFQRPVHAVGAWPGILVSAALRLKRSTLAR